MTTVRPEPEIPFLPDDWVVDRHNPGQPGQYTGRWRRIGPQIMIQLRFPGGGTKNRPLSCLEKMEADEGGGSLEENLEKGRFGGARDLQRLITYEKLKGSLHEVVYSMEAAQIDFYPYQFKPVLKFINSPTERLVLADEVGLGKTIESALIWVELQARRQARRLLVVCPKILTDKWRDELRTKFQQDARIVDFRDLQQEMAELKANGPGYPFILIAAYTGLRSPKDELDQLERPPEADEEGSSKTRFLRDLRHWPYSFPPFDLVIFDEAHYMRNPATTTFNLGESLAAHEDAAVLCVSATPVHNRNTDLHSLLRLVDSNFFETQGMFDELLRANRPAILAANALARSPVAEEQLKQAVSGMAESSFISNSPLFHQFQDRLAALNPGDKAALAKVQELAEKLDLLGGYINRTRRVQVAENQPLRSPVVLQVEYSTEEMQMYRAVLELVRLRCRRDDRPFHVFQVLSFQLRSASCLPVVAEEIREGRLGDIEELLAESMGEEVYDTLGNVVEMDEELKGTDISELLSYDFEAHDSKFEKLRNLVLEVDEVRDEKIVIFAYYRPTLAYLRRRLIEEGVRVAVIHGGVVHEERWRELERFADPRGPRVLLSSEVGSEGIDLQFCRVMVNYDLPWNPMRVEQRIGRIDRVGQQADRLSIVNFKVRDTIEERLYDRLHSKLLLFANSLGDLESVIGEVVQQLTVDLLSKDLTPEEEQRRIDQAELVIEQQALDIQALEESGEGLIALSDYVQRKITEDRERGRYLQATELEDYLCDFFEREFQGSEINHNTPVPGCLSIRLSPEAQASLADFIRDDHSLSARPLRQRQFAITFRREVLKKLGQDKQRRIYFVNHLSPLIRWITQRNRDRAHVFYNTSALVLEHPDFPAGEYCYRVERWLLRGLTPNETLAYGVIPLDGETELTADASEDVIQQLLRRGRDWNYVDGRVDARIQAHSRLEESLGERFSHAAKDFDAENQTMHQIKVQRVRNFFDRKIDQAERALRTMLEAGRGERVIRATQGLIRRENENKQQRLTNLDQRCEIDMEQEPIAAGVFRVVRPKEEQT